MNDKLKAWLEALRSGKYDQVTGELRISGGFCCLGVACELGGAGVWRDQRFMYEGEEFHGIPPYNIIKEMDLPVEMLEIRIGKDCEDDNDSRVMVNVYHPSVDYMIGVARLNDEGLSFEEIADLIEKTYNYYTQEAASE